MFTQIPRTTANSQSRTLTTRGRRGGGAGAGDPYVPGLPVRVWLGLTPGNPAVNDLWRCGSPGPGTQFSAKEPLGKLAEVFHLGQVGHLADSAEGVELELQHTLKGPAAEVVRAIPPVAAEELGQQGPLAAERVEVDGHELVVGVGDERVSPVDEPDQLGPVDKDVVGGYVAVNEAGRREGVGKKARDLLSQMAGQAEAPEPLRRPGTHLPQDLSPGDRARSRQPMQVADGLAQLRGDRHRSGVIQAGLSDSHPAQAPGDQVWPAGLAAEQAA